MAVAVDASSPIRFSGTCTAGASITSASFTAPADALIVACLSRDGNDDTEHGTTGASDSGGLTWTKRVERTCTEATAGGGSAIFTARTTTSASRTVTLTRTGGPGAGVTWSCKIYVLTGVDVDGTPVDTVGANNEGGSGTNNLSTTSITPGATGLLLCADTDWNQRGLFTSSNLTISTDDFAGLISVCSGYRTCTSGVSVNGNLDAGGTSLAQHKWCQIIVREAAAAATKARPPFRRRLRFFTRSF